MDGSLPPPGSTRPSLRVLRYTSPSAFKQAHLDQLGRLAPHMVDGSTQLSLAKDIAAGDTWLWEIEGTDHSIVLLETHGTDTLWVVGAAGDGILAVAEDIVADLRTIAVAYGLTRIAAVSSREGFESLPDKLGFAAVSTTWELEIDDGR